MCVRECVRVRVCVCESLHLEVVTEACSLQGQEPGAFPVRAGVSRRGRRGNERRKRRKPLPLHIWTSSEETET